MATKKNDSDNWVNVREAAKCIGVSDSRIRQLIGNFEGGILAARRFNGRAWMISKIELKRFAKAHGHEFSDA